MRPPRLVASGDAVPTSALARVSSALGRASGSRSKAVEAIKSAARKLRGAASSGLKKQNAQLRARLREADPKEATKILARDAPPLAANYALSVLDNTEQGKTFEEYALVKPSSATLGVSLAAL